MCLKTTNNIKAFTIPWKMSLVSDQVIHETILSPHLHPMLSCCSDLSEARSH
jgi:hypothetical protein